MKAFGKILLLFLLYAVTYYLIEILIDRGIVDQLVKSGEDQQSHKILNDYLAYRSIKNFICMSLAIVFSIGILKFSNSLKAYYMLIAWLTFCAVVSTSIYSYYNMFEFEIPMLVAILSAYIASGIYFHRHLLFKKEKAWD